MNNKHTILWFAGAFVCAAAAASPAFAANADPAVYAPIFATVFLLSSPLIYCVGDKIVGRRVQKTALSLGAEIKSLAVLVSLRQIETVVYTAPKLLLGGRPLITDIVPHLSMDQERLLTLAATIEEGAAHPVGRAIYYAAVKRGITDFYRRSSFTETPYGAQANLNGTIFRVGDISWVEEEFAMQIPAVLATRADQLAYHGKIPVAVVGGGIPRGLIALKDDVNEAAVNSVRTLNERGFVTRFFGNEKKRFAAALERETGLNIKNGLKPLAMIREIQLMRAKGAFVAVVGVCDTEREVYRAGDLSVAVEALPANVTQDARPFAATDGEDFRADIILRRDICALVPVIKMAHKTGEILTKVHGVAAVVAAIGVLFGSGLLLPFGVPLLTLPYALSSAAASVALIYFFSKEL